MTRHFIESFVRAHGRAPRVLHLSNIANNAFLNAKLLNEAGFDCDVLCNDYYHVMGCPEWEDADFSGDVGDQFHPDWAAVDLGGYQRPPWFAQGSLLLAIDYLLARRVGDRSAATRLWHELGVENRTVRPDASWFAIVAHRVARVLSTGRRWLKMLIARPDAYELVLHKLALWAKHGGVLMRALRLVMLPFVWLAFQPKLWRRNPRVYRGWIDAFSEAFPDRHDQLDISDPIPYLMGADRWSALLAHYDFVIGYAVAGIYPLLAGVPYLAFEHGTLREVPYIPTGEGRLTALAYRKAQHVFVTNFDCLPSAEFLAPNRFTLINHPFDEDHGLAVTGAESQRAELRDDLDAEFLFFFPTRHDWVKGTGYADKANDVFIRAFGQLRASGFRVGAVSCAWGANVADSQALFEALGVAQHVKWISPLPTVAFERMARAADCVVDQFLLGSFGGVMFKAMAVGAPVLTYLDETQLARQYQATPPVINCRTTAEIVNKVPPLIADRSALTAAGAAAREWMQRYHSKRETIHKQVRVFESVLMAGRS